MSEFGKAILVTGVLGGVGSALREQFEKSGYYVIGTDILSDSRGDPFSFFRWTSRNFVTGLTYGVNSARKLLIGLIIVEFASGDC